MKATVKIDSCAISKPLTLSEKQLLNPLLGKEIVVRKLSDKLYRRSLKHINCISFRSVIAPPAPS